MLTLASHSEPQLSWPLHTANYAHGFEPRAPSLVGGEVTDDPAWHRRPAKPGCGHTFQAGQCKPAFPGTIAAGGPRLENKTDIINHAY